MRKKRVIIGMLCITITSIMGMSFTESGESGAGKDPCYTAVTRKCAITDKEKVDCDSQAGKPASCRSLSCTGEASDNQCDK